MASVIVFAVRAGEGRSLNEFFMGGWRRGGRIKDVLRNAHAG